MQRMRETQHTSNVLGRQGLMPNRQFVQSNMRNGMNQEMQRAMVKQMYGDPARFDLTTALIEIQVSCATPTSPTEATYDAADAARAI